MKLVSRRGVFLSSADKANGTKGNFVLSLPYDFVFDENIIFKLFISQLNIRNDFFWTDQYNCCYYVNVTAIGTAAPAAPTLVNPGLWNRFTIPQGCFSSLQIINAVNEQLVLAYPLVPGDAISTAVSQTSILFRAGRLYANQVAAPATIQINFYFLSVPDGTPDGPCNKAMGFLHSNQAYTITPTGLPVVVASRRAADGGTNAPPESSMSETLMSSERVNDLIVRTSMPSDNYTVSKEGPEVTGITINVPIAVAPGGSIIYEDVVGVHAVYERTRSVVNTLMVELLDKNMNPLEPDHDWSFILTIEQYEDTDGLSLKALQENNQHQEEVIQLLKMLLLQQEFTNRV